MEYTGQLDLLENTGKAIATYGLAKRTAFIVAK
jgi:hypothetical protein